MFPSRFRYLTTALVNARTYTRNGKLTGYEPHDELRKDGIANDDERSDCPKVSRVCEKLAESLKRMA